MRRSLDDMMDMADDARKAAREEPPAPPARFDKIPVPNIGDRVSNRGTSKIEKVIAYWPDLRAFEVHVIDDHGHRSKGGNGKPIVWMVVNAGFGDWAAQPDR